MRRPRNPDTSASAETLARIAELLERARDGAQASVMIDCATIAGLRRAVHRDARARARPAGIVARERVDDARHRQRHAAEVAEHRDRRRRPAGAIAPTRQAMRRRRRPSGDGRRGSEIIAENALRHHLQRDVEHGDADHRERDGPRYGALGVAHFAARDQRQLDAREREHQDAATCARSPRPPAWRRCARFSARTKNSACGTAISTSGNSFATVAIEFESHAQRHTAHVDHRPERKRRHEYDRLHRPVAGRHQQLRRWSQTPVDTAAVANVPSIHSNTPEMNPA